MICPQCGEEATPVSIQTRTNIKIALGMSPEAAHPAIDTMLFTCIPCMEEQLEIGQKTLVEIKKGTLQVLREEDDGPEELSEGPRSPSSNGDHPIGGNDRGVTDDGLDGAA